MEWRLAFNLNTASQSKVERAFYALEKSLFESICLLVRIPEQLQKSDRAPIMMKNGTAAVCKSFGCVVIHQPKKARGPIIIMQW